MHSMPQRLSIKAVTIDRGAITGTNKPQNVACCQGILNTEFWYDVAISSRFRCAPVPHIPAD